ncbi:GNAT family N-acetyltransferase [Bacillota bacterium]
MNNIIIRRATAADFGSILRMNEESVHFLSPLTEEKLKHLDHECELHLVAETDGEIGAFCLTFREGADYDSVNYLWFQNHYEKFLYVDRVVVDLSARSAGLGKLLYEEVFKHAGATGVPIITAEIDIEPPNPISLRFHEKFGFNEVGKQEIGGGKKVVSLQMARCSLPAAAKGEGR